MRESSTRGPAHGFQFTTPCRTGAGGARRTERLRPRRLHHSGRDHPRAATPAPAAPTSGIDLAGIDKAVQPGDDFDAYANGTWVKATEIPADRSSTGTFLKVIELAEKRNADLVQGLEKSNPAAGSNERKIADYYAAYMDEAGIESRGLAPLKPALDRIAAISDVAALSR